MSAQTLTDSEEKEAKAINRESDLGESLPNIPTLHARLSYKPRVKGGMVAMTFLEDGTSKLLISTADSSSDIAPTPERSSWVQGLTETEAGPAWHNHRVAMNTVDPGYMSDAPEMENIFGGVRPLGWEDGAERVLWPVAMAEGEENSVVWGRFLKHYGAVSVNATLG